MTWPLILYSLLTRLFAFRAPKYLAKRAAEGKEDPERLREKLGEPSLPRPDGPTVWLHAASVGEALSILQLVEKLRDARPDVTPVLTTGTVTSARLMARRLPAGAVHQYAPLDLPKAVTKFLDHWRPTLAIWTESEFWPTTLKTLAARNTPVILVNGRLSKKSFRGWRWFPLTSRSILRRFDQLLVQNPETQKRLTRLGGKADRIIVTGSLKEGASPLPHSIDTHKAMKARIAGRPVWCAASTHPGEEAFAADAHRVAQRALPGALLILVPRHPERGDAVAEDLRAAGWDVAQRSRDEALTKDTDIYLADTLGELGLWYRLAPVSFLGGSLVNIGGHNPFEPAALGSAVLYGPHVENFADAFERLEHHSAAVLVNSPEDFGPALVEAMRPDKAAAMAARAWDLVSEGAEATDKVFDVILDALPPEGRP